MWMSVKLQKQKFALIQTARARTMLKMCYSMFSSSALQNYMFQSPNLGKHANDWRRSHPNNVRWHVSLGPSSHCVVVVPILSLSLYCWRKEDNHKKPWLYLVTESLVNFSSCQGVLTAGRIKISATKDWGSLVTLIRSRSSGQIIVIFLIHCPTEWIC
jgi:hypothetical protein